MVDFARKAREARLKVMEMIYLAQSSHIGSNFSCIDILTVLFERLKIDRDEFICSKGWVAASVYYFLAQKGIIPKKDLQRYCKPGEEVYIGLVEPQGKFGLRAAGGAVGYGLSFAVGFAYSKKLKGEKGTVYALLSDGEMDVGMVWESAMVARKLKLNNLVVIVDYNQFQATGTTNDVLPIEPLVSKWQSHGWQWVRGSGHDYEWMDNIFRQGIPYLQKEAKSPIVIIADTIKGKGFSTFENKLEWHYRNIPDDIYARAVKEISHVS